ETKVVIHIFVSINVVNPAAFSVFHKNGIRLVVPVVTGHTKRNPLERALMRGRGFRRSLFVSCDFFFECIVHNFSQNRPAELQRTLRRSFPCSQYPSKTFSETRRNTPT